MQNLKIQYDWYLDIIWTIEYQKRDLSHIHILLFLHQENNFLEWACVNELICAKLSNLTVDLNKSLQRIVESKMTHDSCKVWNFSASCMKNNSKDSEWICEKKFSKSYQIEIIIQINDYSLYRKHQNDHIWIKHMNDKDVHLNNTWMMLYNLYLTRKYNAHINVKICNSVQIIKYIHKYMYKTDNEIHLYMMSTTNLLILFCVQIEVKRVKRSQFNTVQTMLERCVIRKVVVQSFHSCDNILSNSHNRSMKKINDMSMSVRDEKILLVKKTIQVKSLRVVTTSDWRICDSLTALISKHLHHINSVVE